MYTLVKLIPVLKIYLVCFPESLSYIQLTIQSFVILMAGKNIWNVFAPNGTKPNCLVPESTCLCANLSVGRDNMWEKNNTYNTTIKDKSHLLNTNQRTFLQKCATVDVGFHCLSLYVNNFGTERRWHTLCLYLILFRKFLYSPGTEMADTTSDTTIHSYTIYYRTRLFFFLFWGTDVRRAKLMLVLRINW